MKRSAVFAIYSIMLGSLVACNQQTDTGTKGNDAKSSKETSASVPAQVAAPSPTFAACFTLEPNVSYHMAKNAEVSITQSSFNDQPALAYTTSAEGVKSSEYYDPTGRKMLGMVTYGIAAFGGDPNKADTTETYAQPKEFPEDVKPGAHFVVNVPQLTKVVHASKEKSVEKASTTEYTFVGFEEIPIDSDAVGSEKNEKISGVCHLQQTVEGKVIDTWYAPGLGAIKYKITQDGMGLLMSDAITDKPSKGSAAK